jgi:collagenase-like PrtC family protease
MKKFIVISSLFLFSSLIAEKEKSPHAFIMDATVYITSHGLLLFDCEGHTYIIGNIEHHPNCQCKQPYENDLYHEKLQRD